MELLLKNTIVLGLLISTSIIHQSNAYNNKKTRKSDSNQPVCQKPECSDIANEYLSNMDENVNPCDDFYKFVCGKYPQNNPITDDKIEVTQTSSLTNLVQLQMKEFLEQPEVEREVKHFRNLKKYYNACMNTELIENVGLENIKNILENLGGWPVVNDNTGNTEWTSVFHNLNKLGLGRDYIFNFKPLLDVNTNQNALWISQAKFGLEKRFLTKYKYNEPQKAYYKLMVEVAKLFGANDEKALLDMNAVLDFEINLAYPEVQPGARNNYTIQQLQSDFPGISWYDLITNVTLNRSPINYSIMLEEPGYIKPTIGFLTNTPQRVIRNYLIWRGILGMIPYLNKDINALHQILHQLLNDQTKPQPRWKDCLGKIENNLYVIESAVYTRKYFKRRAKNVVAKMVQHIKEEFINILNTTNWENVDKDNAIKKMKAVNAYIGFASELFDDQKLDEIYGTLEIDENNYLNSSLTLLKLNRDIWFNKLLKPVNKTYWVDITPPPTVNAFYLPLVNLIVLPAAKLQGIYFNASRPSYLNFGSIGSAIAHELSHAVENDKASFSNNTKLEIMQRQDCIIHQFNQYTTLGRNLKGHLHHHENLADLNGLKVAYNTYQNWAKENGEEPGLPNMNYTNNQLFWIAAAADWCENLSPSFAKSRVATDQHPIGEFRVNGNFQNLEFFSKDFNCPIGSKMNPETKCKPL